MTEVVQLSTTNITPSFGQLLSARNGAIGAMLGSVPILCGSRPEDGICNNDSCISFQNSQWSTSHSMNEQRWMPAGVQVNSTTLWILGGYGGYNGNPYSNNTEFIFQGQTNGTLGPQLPYGMFKMCAVKRSEQEIFVIGGQDGLRYQYRNETWIYDPQNEFSRKPGPSLNYKRGGHSCSTMKDGDDNLIIVAGGLLDGNAPLDSVEIYNPTSNTWDLGKTIFQPQGYFFLFIPNMY